MASLRPDATRRPYRSGTARPSSPVELDDRTAEAANLLEGQSDILSSPYTKFAGTPQRRFRRRRLSRPWAVALFLLTSLIAAVVIFPPSSLRQLTQAVLGTGVDENNAAVGGADDTATTPLTTAAYSTTTKNDILHTHRPLLTSETSSSHRTHLTSETPSTHRPRPTLETSIKETPHILPNLHDPEAVDAQTVCPGYTASNVVPNDYGFTASLVLAGKACNVYGTDIEALNLSVQYQSADRLSVKLTPTYIDATNFTQYDIDTKYVYNPVLDTDAESTSGANDLKFTWSNEPSFSFTVLRKSSGDVLFSTNGTKLVFENQFIEFKTRMPKNYNVYGLGEHLHALRLGNNFNATIYAADAGDPIDGNIYGSHPFYLDTRYYEVDQTTGEMTLSASSNFSAETKYKSNSHGVYLRNTHGQEVLLRNDSITWRTLGGSIDLFFFSGPTAAEVTKQYQRGAVGLPTMQQYFTFGYHQCRWGYTNWTQLREVVQRFKDSNIPLESIWLDIDYMNQYRDFENDQNTFSYSQAAEFLGQLHDDGQHFIPIVDSAIYIPNPNNASDAYATYARGNSSNVFMMNPDGSQYIGSVWPGYTVFPDWHSSRAQEWWTGELMAWYKKMPFDGIWIDMSEVSSFCTGSCGTGHVTDNPVHPPFSLPGESGFVIYDYPEGFNLTNATEAAAASSASSAQAALASTTKVSASKTTSYLRTTVTPGVRNEDFPPYAINNIHGALPAHAVTPNATHHDGSSEYDVHNIFGHEILNATYNALTTVFPGKRPFIIGRSTFAGSGAVAGHWGGDNVSKWYFMFFAIPQALSFSLFGIPMFGVDTCGFGGNTDEELCNRWMQMSAFFPFYRNHNVIGAISQEPYVWSSVAEATRTAMSIRYSLLPYIYTIFHAAHETGSTVMRALAWDFPDDPTLAAADRQFLLGPSIMVVPVLNQGATSVDGVFPGAEHDTVWYDWYTHAAVNASAGQNLTIVAPLGHIPVYVKGGSVLPLQEPGYTTADSRKNPWSILVALGTTGTASGQLYLDDGESIKPDATRLVDFSATASSLNVSAKGTFQDTNALHNVTVMGVSTAPGKLTLNGDRVEDCEVEYDKRKGVVYITGMSMATKRGAWAADWTLSWSEEA